MLENKLRRIIRRRHTQKLNSVPYYTTRSFACIQLLKVLVLPLYIYIWIILLKFKIYRREYKKSIELVFYKNKNKPDKFVLKNDLWFVQKIYPSVSSHRKQTQIG
jgi:hypothetical protein